MKKIVLLAATFAASTMHTLHTMEMLTTLPTVMFDYFKTCDPYKTALVATIGILVLDKIYPIFPTTKRQYLPHLTFNQTEISNLINQKINAYEQNIAGPAIAAISDRINALPNFDIQVLNTYVTLKTFNEKIAVFTHEHEAVQKYLRDHDYKSEIDKISERLETLTLQSRYKLQLPKNSSDMYEIETIEDKISLTLIHKKFQKMKKRFINFKEICLETISKSSPAHDENLFRGFSFNEFGSGTSTPTATPRTSLTESLDPKTVGMLREKPELVLQSPREGDEEDIKGEDEDN